MSDKCAMSVCVLLKAQGEWIGRQCGLGQVY